MPQGHYFRSPELLQSLNKNFKPGAIPWNKGKKTGHVPWNKGKKGVQISARKGKKTGHTPWNKGTKGLVVISKETRELISISLKGRTGWSKGLHLNEAHRNAIKAGSGSDGWRTHYLRMTHKNMMSRCYNTDNIGYPYYLSLGVTVWDPWHTRSLFILGILSILGDRPLGYSIDRVNPWGDYDVNNVRWADRTTQNNNRRFQKNFYYSQCGEH